MPYCDHMVYLNHNSPRVRVEKKKKVTGCVGVAVHKDITSCDYNLQLFCAFR